MNEKMNFLFGVAVALLRQGGMVRRPEWPKDTFVFMQVPANIPQEVIPNMQSLPKAVKAEFERRSKDEQLQVSGIQYCNQLAIVNCSNLIESYSPSVADSMAEDWEVYEGNQSKNQ
jgi:hypothetical protein